MDQTSLLTLARLLSTAGLTAATIEYVEILKRRQARRVAEAERADHAAKGLAGLVRVLVADRSGYTPGTGHKVAAPAVSDDGPPFTLRDILARRAAARAQRQRNPFRRRFTR